MFDFNPLYLADGYKLAHKQMLAPDTTTLYATWIPRKIKYFPEGIEKVVSIGQSLVWQWLHDQFQRHFFEVPFYELDQFVADMTNYLGLPYDGDHFKQLHQLGYLPIQVKSLEEGIETPANVPHMTFVNTEPGFAWLTLYLETIVSAASWKMPTSATLALQYRRNVEEWVNKTDSENAFLIPFMCHDFSARGLSPWDMVTSGLGHASCFRGSDTLAVIPTSRKFYHVPKDEVIINSVNASEHSVSTTRIFTIGELEMLRTWLNEFPEGILSVVMDTFDITAVARPDMKGILYKLKDLITSREGKLVIRPDSSPKPLSPVDIICGWEGEMFDRLLQADYPMFYRKGLVQCLAEIFGTTTTKEGYKLLDTHIGVIYGDAINLERQVQIYERLAEQGYAATNVVLGVGSFTYQFNSRDSLGWAAKGAWFETRKTAFDAQGRNIRCESSQDVPEGMICSNGLGVEVKSYNIHKDPITDSGTKKSLKGMIRVNSDLTVAQECTPREEQGGLLKVIYEDGKFFNLPTFEQIRENINSIV